MEKAIYGLVVTIIGRMVYGWSKGYYFKYKMYRQLKAEVIFLQKSIADNRQIIEADPSENGFPLLKKIELSIHEKMIPEYILDNEVSSIATQLVSNCYHYNRIVELGEKDTKRKQRKDEVVKQGALIFNQPTYLFFQSGDLRTPYISQTQKYIETLDQRLKQYRAVLKRFPWFFLLYKFDGDELDSHIV